MPVKVLMVCLGNICRSPLAEGLLASKLPKDNFIVDSAGTGNWHVGKNLMSVLLLLQKKTNWIFLSKEEDNFNRAILILLITSM
jgi:protein-tyrosine phosphatase